MMSVITGDAPNDRIHPEPLNNRFLAKSRSKAFPLPSQFLVVDWGTAQANFSVYHKKHGEFTRVDNFSLTWENSGLHLSSNIGEQLSRELALRKIKVQNVVVSVPRRFVVVKDLRLPRAIIQSDLSGIVRLQCEKIFPVNLSTLVIDYIVSDAPNSDNEISVLVAAIPEDVIKKISNSLSVAKLKIVAMGIIDLGIAKIEKDSSNELWQLHVLSAASRTDFVLAYNQFPVISYGSDTPVDQPSKLGFFVSSIERMLHSAKQQSLVAHPLSIHMHGVVEESIQEELWKRLSQKFVYYKSHAKDESRDRAIIAAYKTQEGAINFDNPRKPVDMVARSRNRSFVLAALILLACGLLSIPPLLSIEKLDRQIVESQNTRRSLQERLDRMQSIEKTWKQIVAFERSKVDISTEIRQLIERLKPADEMYLANLELQENPNSGSTVVRLKGRVKNRETFSELTDELLLATDKYRLQPPLLEPVSGDDHYAFSFIFELELKS